MPRRHGHPFLQWNSLLNFLLIEPEVRRLHKRFIYPHADKLYNLLDTSAYSDVNKRASEVPQEMRGERKPHQTYVQAFRRLKFSLRDKSTLNSSVRIKIIHVNSKPVPDAVIKSTIYQADSSLSTVFSEFI